MIPGLCRIYCVKWIIITSFVNRPFMKRVTSLITPVQRIRACYYLMDTCDLRIPPTFYQAS